MRNEQAPNELAEEPILSEVTEEFLQSNGDLAATAGDADLVALARERLEILARQLAPGAREVIRRLSSLLDEEETDEYGALRPTVFAFNRAAHLVYHAARELSESFPVGAICRDDRGGCRFEWTGVKRQVRLAVPAEEA